MGATTRKPLKIPMISSIRAPGGQATLGASGEASRWVPTTEGTPEGPSLETQDTKMRRWDNIELFMTHLSPRTTRIRWRKTSTKKLAIVATSAEAGTLPTMRIQTHTLITTISNKIPMVEAAIKSSGDWDAVNLPIIAETKNLIPTVDTISNMTQGTTTQMISSLPERAEAVAEDPPIRYMELKNLCLPQTRAEASLLDTGEASLCTNNMIPIRILILTAISSRITYRPSLHHLRNICNPM